jgi:hypothetical protein
MAAPEYFAREATKLLVTQARTALTALASSDKKKTLLESALNIVSANPVAFDENCATNIEWIGGSIADALKNVAANPKNDGAVDTLYALLYRCVLELDVSTKSDLSIELLQFKQYANDQRARFIADAQQQFVFAEQAMPIALLKRLVNSDEIQKLRETKTFAGIVDAKITAWEQDLQRREARVQDLATEIGRYEHAFNFVGLHQGFDELSAEKSRELWALRIVVFLLGLLVLAPLGVESAFIYGHFPNVDSVKWGLAATAFPVISLTVIFAYFFRLAIRSADGAKSQLLQIELRKTLCRFIQSYAEYTKRLKQDGGESLAKFENIVFSGIVANDEKIPATFDGMEQLSKLLKTVKGSS